MRAWVSAAVAVAVVGLAGCKAKDETPAPAASASSAMQSSAMAPAATAAKPMTMADLVGTWDDNMADGSKSITKFMSDGTYEDTDAKGKVEKGKFAIKDDKVCMTPDAGKAQCWATSAPMADGSMTATSDDGQKITVKKRAA